MNYLATEMEYRMNLESKALFKRPGLGSLHKFCKRLAPKFTSRGTPFPLTCTLKFGNTSTLG